MIGNLIYCLVLTLIIELTMSFLLGVRNKNDILTVICVNTLTNPVLVFVSNVIFSFLGPVIYWIALIIMEIVVFIIEGKIFECNLIYKKISGLRLSFINNVMSFGIGIIILIISNSNIF